MRMHLIGAGVFGTAALTLASAALADPLIYIPLGGEARILVVDAAGDTIIGAIDGLPAVHGLAATLDGRRLIAGSYEERMADGLPAKPKGVSEDEHAAHHAPKKAASAADPESVSAVSIIRRSDGVIIRSIDVPGPVHHVSVSPDSRFAVVTRPNQDAISVIDLDTYGIVANIQTGSMPNYALFSPDGRTLYVSNAGDDAIAIIDTDGWRSRGSVQVGASPEHMVPSPAGDLLYVNNVNDGSVSVIDLAALQVLRTIDAGVVLHGIDVSADGSYLLVADVGDDRIARIDLEAGAVDIAEMPFSPYHLTFIPGGAKVYVSSASDEILRIVDPTTLAVTGELTIGGKGHQMTPVSGT